MPHLEIGLGRGRLTLSVLSVANSLERLLLPFARGVRMIGPLTFRNWLIQCRPIKLMGQPPCKSYLNGGTSSRLRQLSSLGYKRLTAVSAKLMTKLLTGGENTLGRWKPGAAADRVMPGPFRVPSWICRLPPSCFRPLRVPNPGRPRALI